MSALFETGFFVEQSAWHQEGIVLEEAPNSEEAYEQSGLNWEVDSRPLHFLVPGVNRRFNTDLRALVRSTDLRVLGACKRNYEVFQNKEAFDWCEPLVQTDWWHYETAGSLKGGEYCWALLKQDEKEICLLYTSPSPRDVEESRMPSSA